MTKKTNRRTMKQEVRSRLLLTGLQQERNLVGARKTTESRRDFQKERSVVLLIMINVFLLHSFQCDICGKKPKPPTAAGFRRHMKRTHQEDDFCKCTFSECNYVRYFPLNVLNIQFSQGTGVRANMRRHVRQVHEGRDRMDCPCCGMNILR